MRISLLTLSVGGLLALSGCTLLGGGEDGDGENGTEDVPVDSDGDGLTDDEEAELGTDPEAEDSDFDGWSDTEEIEAGSDPLSCSDVVEGWADCSAQAEADGISETGWSIGDTVGDWDMVDQYGNVVDFYQFYGQVIVLDMSAGWCGPCQSAAAEAEAEYQHYKDQGVQFIHLMIDDYSYDGYVTDESFTSDWASTYGLTFPVVTDDDMNGYAVPYYEFYMEGYVEGVPTFAIIDSDMTLHDIWSGYSSSYTASAIDSALSD